MVLRTRRISTWSKLTDIRLSARLGSLKAGNFRVTSSMGVSITGGISCITSVVLSGGWSSMILPAAGSIDSGVTTAAGTFSLATGMGTVMVGSVLCAITAGECPALTSTAAPLERHPKVRRHIRQKNILKPTITISVVLRRRKPFKVLTILVVVLECI
ncbi:hypothetical protein ES703_63025 [subsurface metagenome]